MSNGSSKKTRSQRVATVALRPGRLTRWLEHSKSPGFAKRIGLCFLAALILWMVTTAWAPRFGYRSGYIPERDIVARYGFSITDENGAAAYQPGSRLADGGRPLSTTDIQRLYSEYVAGRATLSWLDMIQYSLADLGMYVAMYVLCGCYIYYHHRRLLSDLRPFVSLLGAAVVTVTLAVVASRDAWRAESIPLAIFGMTMAIVHRRELALLLVVTVSLVVAVSLDQSLAEFILLTAAGTAPILLLGKIRSRTKLIYVGVVAGAFVLLTAVGVGVLVGQAYGIAHTTHLTAADEMFSRGAFMTRLLSGATWLGVCVMLGGFLMSGILPFIEKLFDIQTDISLLELGDAAHPLLQELAHRAPGTYNHSINVASIGEAAAEAIGANGLLVRVGAYFHDIGKMLKPAYFVENQGQDGNQHDALLPAMSTLVIIAHVKDGIDLAKQHRLPKSIVDFIEQHHGTTLVEYFYRQAAKKQQEDNPDAAQVDETSYRYPGPRPQTQETAVMMLADASESACRSLVDPAPSRIESLVHKIAINRMQDGQFDECNLTFRQLHIIEDSLVKSLTAVYHGRVKYPDQQTA